MRTAMNGTAAERAMRSRIAHCVAGLAVAALASGCLGSSLGTQYLPERNYYRLYGDFYDVDVKLVKHVHEELWGMYVFGSQIRKVSVRDLVERELAASPDYYVSDLSIHTDVQGTVMFTFIAAGMALPKTTVDFDVLEVKPWRKAQAPRPAAPRVD